MSDFAPSPAAAQKALAGKNVITHASHPGGSTGVRFSLEEVARKIKDARNDPRLKGWAGQVLIAAGRPQGVRAGMQALLDAFKAKTLYVDDPTQTEMIAKPHVTLCLDPHGLCMPASDCDDRVVALGGAAASLNWDVRVIGQAFGGAPDASHVIFAVYDPIEKAWLKVDSCGENWTVGMAAPATREWEIDPMTMTTTQSFADVSPNADRGDFVSIGALPGRAPSQGVGNTQLVLPSDVATKKAQVQAEVQGLQAMVDACTTLQPATKTAFEDFVNAWTSFYNAPNDFWSAGAEYNQAETYEAQAASWQTLLVGAGCTSALPTITPTVAGATTPQTDWVKVATYLAIGVSVVSAAYVLAPVVAAGARRRLRPKAGPKRMLPTVRGLADRGRKST
jgi:hypothetical protein